nr:hypothetical protein [Escherichia coli]UWM21827.1 hypothetical protein [Escherichia coli]WDZ03927.1 hypothetical protein [Escherichia coli]
MDGYALKGGWVRTERWMGTHFSVFIQIFVSLYLHFFSSL